MRSVQVLLSTFNGERYLPALVESLVRQTDPHVSILARDDGSSDGTTVLLDRYASAGTLRWYGGPHLGVRGSFLDLLARADGAAAAFAFCDQDDVWMPGKVARARARLAAEGDARPALYCARACVVDEHLRPFGHTMRPRRGPSVGNALVENIAPGCTMVLNGPARALLLREVPRCPGFHDAWAYLVVSALGRVIYDDAPAVLYRQHADNVVGARHRRWRWRIARLATIREDRAVRGRFVAHAAELERLFGAELDPATREIVSRFVRRQRGVLASVRYALRSDVHRQGAIDNLILKTLIAVGQI